MSTAILRLSENGELQEIHDRWFCRGSCDKGSNRGSEPNHLHLRSFWGLFLICGAATVLAFLVFLLRTVHQFIRYNRKQRASSLVEQQSSSGRSQAVYSFFDFIDEKEEAIENMFKQHERAQPPVRWRQVHCHVHSWLQLASLIIVYIYQFPIQYWIEIVF